MTQRVENGTTYTQTFDVENRLVSVAVSGGGTTHYQYDANGQMVKKIAPDGTVTVYLGLVEYEIDGGVTETTSYYSVPGARVVRVNSTLSYVLTDHLGSSSVTLDDGGNESGMLRYYAYGETRISTGSTPTERWYTGQVRQDDIGLDYFNARWYSSRIGRFVSADVMVPDAGNPQALNRFTYSRNNPVKYIDPSGHAAICGQQCEEENDYQWIGLLRYGITLVGKWSINDVKKIRREVKAIADKLAASCTLEGCVGMHSFEVFHEIFGPMELAINDDNDMGIGCVAGAGFSCSEGTAGRLSENSQSGLVTHELGHVFDHSISGWGYARSVLGQSTITDANGNYVEGRPLDGGGWVRTNAGYRSDWFPDQQHPLRLDDAGRERGEDFADMFMNWTHNSFANNPAGQARYAWMNRQMALFVDKAILQP
jgi:RHS repeat-associated protein